MSNSPQTGIKEEPTEHKNSKVDSSSESSSRSSSSSSSSESSDDNSETGQSQYSKSTREVEVYQSEDSQSENAEIVSLSEVEEEDNYEGLRERRSSVSRLYSKSRSSLSRKLFDDERKSSGKFNNKFRKEISQNFNQNIESKLSSQKDEEIDTQNVNNAGELNSSQPEDNQRTIFDKEQNKFHSYQNSRKPSKAENSSSISSSSQIEGKYFNINIHQPIMSYQKMEENEDRRASST